MIHLILIFVLLLLNGLFALAEIAVVSSRKSKLQNMAEEGNAQAQMALNLVQKPSNFLSTIQIGITVIGIMIGAIGEANIVNRVAEFLKPLPFIGVIHEPLAFFIVVALITYFSLVIGEIVPKRIALTNPERFASILAPFMKVLAKVTHPLVTLLSLTTDTIVRIFHIKPSSDSGVSEEEILIMIKDAARMGVFRKKEKELVERALTLDDLRITSLITPRNQIEWFDIKTFTENPKKQLTGYRRTRVILCEETIDHVVGIVHVKDFLQKYFKNEKVNVKRVLMKPLFIPEKMKALRALELFRRSPTHMALVVDEFGNVQGLVTLTDILEALIGDIHDDPKEEAEEEIVKRPDGSYLIDGMVSTEELKKLLKIEELPKEEDEDFQTLGGFIVSYLDRIPITGEPFEWENYRFEVIDMDGHRVDKVLVTKMREKKE